MDFDFAQDDVPPAVGPQGDDDVLMDEEGGNGDEAMEEGADEHIQEEQEEDESPVTQEDAWAVIRLVDSVLSRDASLN